MSKLFIGFFLSYFFLGLTFYTEHTAHFTKGIISIPAVKGWLLQGRGPAVRTPGFQSRLSTDSVALGKSLLLFVLSYAIQVWSWRDDLCGVFQLCNFDSQT